VLAVKLCFTVILPIFVVPQEAQFFLEVHFFKVLVTLASNISEEKENHA
jgi:hypothetical protein